MKKQRAYVVFSMINVIAILAVTLPLASAYAATGHGQHGQMSKMKMTKSVTAKPLSLEKVYQAHFPMVTQSIDKAFKAIESGDRKTALAELTKAKKMMAMINEAISKLVKPKFANAACPIMGSPINPDKVAKNLIRDYKGQKVAFCCEGCPQAWDKLTDAKKDAKLAEVKPKQQSKPADAHAGHSH